MSEHQYLGSCVDPNPLRVERQDPDNFPRMQTRERCALEIAAYVFKDPQNEGKELMKCIQNKRCTSSMYEQSLPKV